VNTSLSSDLFGKLAPSAPGASPIRLAARGGGWAVFKLRAGDRATLTNLEGLQAGWLFVLAKGGAEAGIPDLLTAQKIEFPISQSDNATVRPALAAERARIEDLAGFALFAADAEAGGAVTLDATADALCLLHAPGVAMAPDAQNAPTDLRIEIDRAPGVEVEPPPPLAEPKLDLRIRAASAEAFRVSAGDYIQIIDVEGRQCSDFLAFDAVALADGRECGLDATTTRTLMGSSYPTPGLHSKFFAEDQRPFVEVIQDTVGRHDSFMLACSAKYYDDMGYPGHGNCTANFNAALQPYGVEPRAGWPALNFFYNTILNADQTITLDEPWSRPGDYVLLRALTDLVCASSSCTDDIDPANGWFPTDIHVRVYDAANSFPKGLAHRMTPDADPRLSRDSGFHPRTSALTRNFQEYRGFWLPTCYAAAGPIEEYWACRERAVVMDLSALRKFEITGPDAEALMQLAVTRNVRKLAVGQVVYTAICYPHGGMMDDGTIFRLGDNNFRWICGDDYSGVWLRQLAQEHGLKAWVRSSTDQLHNIAVQGPLSRDILKDIVVTPPHQARLDELKWFRFTIGKIAGAPVIVSRTGYTGELGYEIWCHPDQAVTVWDAVWAAGQPHGLTPMGLTALDMVRIEAGLVFAGYDFCDQTDPFEAGIGFTVAADKADDYIGREALQRRRETPLRKLIGLDIVSTDPVHHGDPVYLGRARIGEVTSATRSPILRKTIALARLDVQHAAGDLAVEIGKLDGHQKRIAAKVVGFPHYDPQKTRVRA
jgi:aminomethyltransferase